MKAHLEMRELSSFILTVAKEGHKVGFLGSEDCTLFYGTKPHRKPCQISLEQSIEAWELIKNSGYVIRTQSSGEVLERLSRNCTACPMSMKKRLTCLGGQIRQQ